NTGSGGAILAPVICRNRAERAHVLKRYTKYPLIPEKRPVLRLATSPASCWSGDGVTTRPWKTSSPSSPSSYAARPAGLPSFVMELIRGERLLADPVGLIRRSDARSLCRRFADVDPHRAEEAVFVTDAGEAGSLHQLGDAALAWVSLERRRDVKVGLR